jgi:hypothetical protein
MTAPPSLLDPDTHLAQAVPDLRPLVAVWAAAGPVVLLGWALWRLAPRAWEAVLRVQSLSSALLLASGVVVMIWLEGHRGFHLRVVPEVTERVRALARHARGWRLAAAPLVACELLGAPPARLLRRWVLLLGVVALMLAVRQLPAAARGIAAAGVFSGLAWGLGSLLIALRAGGASPRERT